MSGNTVRMNLILFATLLQTVFFSLTTKAFLIPASQRSSVTSNQRSVSWVDGFRKNEYSFYAKNWDDLILDEEEDGFPQEKIAFDMKYNKRNCDRSNQNYIAIKEANGPTNDVYCRRVPDDLKPGDPFESDVFWFIGKVARISDVTVKQCISRQWHLITHHAANLRPLDLFPALGPGRLELWVAPGDSEMQVAYNSPSITFQKMEKEVEGAEQVKNAFIGFQGELYANGEEGFRTLRTSDGKPARPEIQAKVTEDSQLSSPDQNTEDQDLDEFRMPTDDEMKKIFEALEGKDINEIYEEQQRREKE